MFFGFKQFLKTSAALAAALGCAAFVRIMHAASFSGGESSYYLYSVSSQAEIKPALSLSEFGNLTGECAEYVLDESFGAVTAEELTERIRKEYRAQICFSESACGTVSFYAYSPSLKGGVLLNGYKVNLHIAFRGNSVAVGTPMIFGGY